MSEPTVILFGGKGGVGKTTCSTVVAAASAAPSFREETMLDLIADLVEGGTMTALSGIRLRQGKR